MMKKETIWDRLHQWILWSRNTVLIVGILAMLLATLPNVNGTPLVWVNMVLTFVLLFFLLDWVDFVRLARLAKHPGMVLRSFHHITHGLAVVPLVAAFALGIPQTTAWTLGSLWLLKLPTATSGFALLLRVIKLEAKSLMSVAIMFLCVLLFSSVVMHVAEGGVQPENFGTLPHALYWAVTTLTTTGYGDVVPATSLGRLTAGCVMISGLAVFGLWTGILSTGFATESRRREFVRTWELVAKVPFFHDLKPAAIIEIARMLRRWDVPERSVIVRKGHPGDAMYFIVSGRVGVVAGGQPRILREGSFFGEMALLGNGVRSATVTTLAPATLLVLDLVDFQVLAANYPELTNAVEAEAEHNSALDSLNQAPDSVSSLQTRP